MSEFVIQKGSTQVAFTEVERFMEAVDILLKLGERFAVSIAKSAERVVGRLNVLFARYGLRVEISVDSDPSAADYFIAAAVGASAGAGIGAVAGAGAWLAVRALATAVVPAAAPFLLAGTIIGGVVGASSGMAVTHWGLRVRFAPVSRALEFELAPFN